MLRGTLLGQILSEKNDEILARSWKFSQTNIMTLSNFPGESEEISIFSPQMFYSMHLFKSRC